MNENQPAARRGWAVFQSTTFKILTIGFLILVLLIPAGMVRGLIWEREHRRAEVIKELGAKWGDAQTVTGPILIIPYQAPGRPVQHLHVLPEKLALTGTVRPEIRYRGIYEAVLYNAKLSVTGAFALPDFRALGIPEKGILWDRVTVALGLSDLQGLEEQIVLRSGAGEYAMETGTASPELLPVGVSARIPAGRKTAKVPFEVGLDLNGSRQLAFVPVGKTTAVELTSTWDSPSFDGAFLPEERTITADGFQAKWKVLDLNRNYPQAWTGHAYNPASSSFGVKLVLPADAYQKSVRTAKYAAMFIALTFLAFFVSEVMTRIRIHPFQYLLVGLALVLFYSLLISFSEHLSFGAGYLVSSVATLLLVSGYARAILRRRSLAVMVGSLLAVLYSYFYVLLQLEDYALLLGSIGLFVILAVVMYLTRKINWYSPEEQAR